jgi:hypothetical protein
MRIAAALTAIAVAALVVLMMQFGPTPQGHANASVTGAVDSVVGTSGPTPVQLIGRGHGHGGYRGHHSGGVHNFHRGGHHHRGSYFYGGSYGGPYYGGQGIYEDGDEICVWNGYQYRCYKTY